MLQAALPNIFPGLQIEKEHRREAISPTFLVLKPHEDQNNFDRKITDFFEATTRIFDRCGATGALFQKVVRKTKASYDQEVHQQVQAGNHGLIFIPREH